MKRRLLVVGAGRYQLPAIRVAREMGLYVIAVDGNPEAVGLKEADASEVADVRDSAACLKIARRERVDGVVSICTEAAVETVATVAEELGLPGIGREAARAATDKSVMRQKFAAAGLPGPRFGSAASLAAAREVAARIGYPLVIKPVDNAGSRGVRRVESEFELPEAVDLAMEYSWKKRVILEEFLEGIESTIESLSYGGRTEVLGISDKKHVPSPECVAICLTYPPSYSQAMQQAVADVVRRAVAALGIMLGPSHSEVIVTADGPRLVEVAARGGGFRVFSDIVALVSGVDIVRETLKIALDMEPDIRPRWARAAVLRFFNPGVQGYLRGIRGVESARRVPGIRDVVIEVEPGNYLGKITGDGERPGYLIAEGETRQEAVRRADIAEKMIRFDIVTAEELGR